MALSHTREIARAAKKIELAIIVMVHAAANADRTVSVTPGKPSVEICAIVTIASRHAEACEPGYIRKKSLRLMIDDFH
jgi:hypothetical protein